MAGAPIFASPMARSKPWMISEEKSVPGQTHENARANRILSGSMPEKCGIEGVCPRGMGAPPVWALVFGERLSLQTGETPGPPVFALIGHVVMRPAPIITRIFS